jgi:hypothetical protein
MILATYCPLPTAYCLLPTAHFYFPLLTFMITGNDKP